MSGLARYVDLAEWVRRSSPRLGPVRLVAVDGPAGSGKTTFAARLTDALREGGTTVAEIHTDDLLEGWADIVSFWPRLADGVLAPLRRGEPGSYRRYDWHAGAFAEAVPVPPEQVVVVEGVTSARAAIRPELTLSVLVTASAEVRLARGIARDGEALRPQWLRWMRAEEDHFTADTTADNVLLLVDGASGVPHDLRSEYVALADRRFTRLTAWGTIGGEAHTGRETYDQR